MINEIISNIINTTLESFDFPFCITVNILTYLIISIISEYKHKAKISTWNKRIIFILVSIITAIVYYFAGGDIKTIFNSIVLAPVSWSWIFKPICAKLNLDYNKKDKD